MKTFMCIENMAKVANFVFLKMLTTMYQMLMKKTTIFQILHMQMQRTVLWVRKFVFSLK
jgi:hypothetical protein